MGKSDAISSLVSRLESAVKAGVKNLTLRQFQITMLTGYLTEKNGTYYYKGVPITIDARDVLEAEYVEPPGPT